MIEYLLPALPALMAAGAFAAVAGAVVRRRRLDAAWYRGVTVEGRCLRTFVTTTTWRRGTRRQAHRSLSHVYEFTTPDGRTLRFEEDGRGTVFDGDTVTVRYPQGRPDRATALPPGDRGTKAKFRLQLVCLGFATVLCLAVTAVFSLTTGLVEAPDTRPPASPASPASPGRAVPPSLPSLPSGPPDGFPEPPAGWPTDMPKPPGH